MKQVIDTAAAKSISAYIILKEGVHIATVQAHFANSGGVIVDVFNTKEGLIHQGKAGGYGYDKFTAALAGAVIDGVKLYDHCGGYEPSDKALKEKGVELYQTDEKKAEDFADKYGMDFFNWVDGKPMSCYFKSGLDRITALGYIVIKAI